MVRRGKLLAVLLAVITVLAAVQGKARLRQREPQRRQRRQPQRPRRMRLRRSRRDRKEEETTPEGMEKEARAAAGPGAEDCGAAESEAGDKDIEAFAELVQEAVADRDMEALADLAAFPLNLETADGEKMTFADRNEFLKTESGSDLRGRFDGGDRRS